NKSCKVRKSNRRSCQFCRFAKCRKNGMKISWVMTEEER
ncbi:Zinc finger nuclear hormone receptor-type, partial [Trinorchestia longiramus]